MCIIGFAPKGANISDEKIYNMCDNNPHGFGVMWKPNDGSPIKIHKGFFEEDIKDLLKLWHSLPKDCDRALHCRIATAGRITTSCCHPFPVRDTTYAMKSRKDSCGMAFMHNGIIRLTDPPKGIKSPFSDSMMFGKEVLYPIKDALDSIYIQQMLEGSIDGSRMLIFRQKGEAIMLGHWLTSDKCFFSNDSYNKRYYSYIKSNTKTLSTPSDLIVQQAKTAVKSYSSWDWTNACEDCRTFDCANCHVDDGYSSPYNYEDMQLDDETRFLDDQYEDMKDEKEVNVNA